MKVGKATAVGFATGAIAGLATITPAAGSVGPLGAVILGALAGLVCFYAVHFVKGRLQIDDSLDVFAVHGVGGIIGSIWLAILAAPSFCGTGYAEGISIGSQLWAQHMDGCIVGRYSAVVSPVS